MSFEAHEREVDDAFTKWWEKNSSKVKDMIPDSYRVALLISAVRALAKEAFKEGVGFGEYH